MVARADGPLVNLVLVHLVHLALVTAVLRPPEGNLVVVGLVGFEWMRHLWAAGSESVVFCRLFFTVVFG